VRYVQLPGEPGVVELAATVADDWQGMGLGSALVAGLMQRACDEGHSAVRASVLAANSRSIAMLRRAGFKGRPATGTLREYELALCPNERPVLALGCSPISKQGSRGVMLVEVVFSGFGEDLVAEVRRAPVGPAEAGDPGSERER
jgi:hypothetical protein